MLATVLNGGLQGVQRVRILIATEHLVGTHDKRFVHFFIKDRNWRLLFSRGFLRSFDAGTQYLCPLNYH